MDVLIKSFNRPYYLDRCIYSIKKYCLAERISIKILDDGTPKKYLDRIKEKYPDVSIVYSSSYKEKALFCEHKTSVVDWKIPADFWKSEAAKASDYFMLLEDDNWFMKPLQINSIEQTLKSENTILLKLLWLGNSKLISDQFYKKDPEVHIYKPDLIIRNPQIYNLFFRRFKRKVFKSLFKFIGIDRFSLQLHYYTIYSVAGAIYNRDYFCALWDQNQQEVDESNQIFNALQYLKKNRSNHKFTFANSSQEVMKTGFISSSTNSFKKHTQSKIDMFSFNNILNEAWYEGAFNTTEDLSKDISSYKIKCILASSDISFEAWQQWSNDFKDHYASFGCQIA